MMSLVFGSVVSLVFDSVRISTFDFVLWVWSPPHSRARTLGPIIQSCSEESPEREDTG